MIKQQDDCSDSQDDDSFYIVDRHRKKTSFQTKMLIILIFFITVFILCWRVKEALLSSVHVVNGQQYLLIRGSYPELIAEENGQKQGNELEMYIPKTSFYNDIYGHEEQFTSHSLAESWRSNLVQSGKMIQELESWVSTNVQESDMIVIVWSDKLALTTLLATQKIKLKQNNTLTLLVNPHHPQSILRAFKQTLLKYQLSETIHWDKSHYTNFRTMNSSNVIMISGELFHNKMLNNVFVFDEKKVSQAVNSLLEDFSQTKIVIYYESIISNQQKEELIHLESHLSLIISTTDGKYLEVPFSQVHSELSTRHFSLFLLDPNKKSQKNASQDKQANDDSSKNIIELEKSSPSQLNQSSTQNISTVSKRHPKKQIDRLPPGDIAKKIQCTSPTSMQFTQPLNFFQTIYKNISLLREEHIDHEEAVDMSHLAKFLANYFSSSEMNSFFAMNSQQIANLVALLINGQILFPYMDMRKGDEIESSWEYNYFDKKILKINLKDEDVSQFIGKVNITFLDLQLLGEWMNEVDHHIGNGMDLIMRIKNNFNELQVIKGFKAKGYRIYVIYMRKEKDFDINCVRDFQFQKHLQNKRYPAYSFYFVSNSDIFMERFDPIDFDKTNITRNMKIFPSFCTQPPYHRLQYQKRPGYAEIQTKYQINILAPESKVKIYQQYGVEDQALIEFILSCIVQNDKVIVHGSSLDSQLWLIILMKKILKYGQIKITPLMEQQQKVIEINAQINGISIEQDFFTDIRQNDVSLIKELYFTFKPNFIVTTCQFLKKYGINVEELKKGTVLAFRYDSKMEFLNTILDLLKQHTLYKIVNQKSSDIAEGQCQNYQLSLITKQSWNSDPGWLVAVI